MEEKMYKAKIEIGGYKVGEEVPSDKARIWNEMYLESPVEKIVKDKPIKVNNRNNDSILSKVSKDNVSVKKENIVNENIQKKAISSRNKLKVKSI